MSRSFLFPSPCREEIPLKTRAEIDRLKLAGRTVAEVLREVAKYVRPGTNTDTLEKICERRIDARRKSLRIEKFPDFPTYLSVSVNDTAVHGLPCERKLGNGDIVTLDLVLKVNGWFGDAALSLPVGTVSPLHARLIEAAKKATFAGIRMARAGKRIGDVAAAIEASAAKSGVRLFEGLVGHGVGRDLHEGPPVFVKGEAGVGQAIVPGMVFTIEPVVTFGTPSYYTGEDGFSLITEDGQWASVFEHTVAVFSDRTEILTRLPKQMKEKPSLSHQEPFGA